MKKAYLLPIFFFYDFKAITNKPIEAQTNTRRTNIPPQRQTALNGVICRKERHNSNINISLNGKIFTVSIRLVQYIAKKITRITKNYERFTNFVISQLPIYHNITLYFLLILRNYEK